MDANPEVGSLLNTADVLFNAGWVAKACEIYQTVADCGHPVDPGKYGLIEAACRKRAAEQRELGDHQPIAIHETSVVGTLHFAGDLTAVQKRIAFESGVRSVDIETSSQCNRRCLYCPNSKYDRLSGNRFLPREVFERVIEQLASIGYYGFVHFHGYNEPLMHLDDLIPRIKLARAKLPQARLGIYTNGDYLDPDALRALEDSGVNYLQLSIHLAPGKAWNERDIFDRLCRKSKELGLQTLLSDFIPDTLIRCSLIGSKVQIGMQEWNIMTTGSTRGRLVPDVGTPVTGRTTPCIRPLEHFVIYNTGDVVSCCDFVPDAPEHKDYVIGNVAAESIFDIYSSERARRRRADALSNGPKMTPCDTCGTCINQPPFPAETQGEIDAVIATVQAMSALLADDPERDAVPA